MQPWASYSDLLDWVRSENWMPEFGDKRQTDYGERFSIIFLVDRVPMGPIEDDPSGDEISKNTVLNAIAIVKKSVLQIFPGTTTFDAEYTWWLTEEQTDDGNEIRFIVEVWRNI